MSRDLREEARRSPLAAHKDEMLRLYVEGGLTFDELGAHYGVSREWARLILPPDAYEQKQQFQENKRLAQRFLQACRKALAESRICKTCGGWILRDRDVTCSPECHEAYKVLRTVDDPDYHRRAMAKVMLRRPNKYPEVRLEWARRMLGPNPPPRNRTFLIPGSERAEVIKKYRPELYEELVAS